MENSRRIGNYRFFLRPAREELFPFELVAARCVSFVFLPRSDATLCNARVLDGCRAILMRVLRGRFPQRAHSAMLGRIHD